MDSLFSNRRYQLKLWFKRLFRPKRVQAYYVDVPQGKFLIHPDDNTVGRKLLRKGNYALNELEHINNLVGAESKVLFVGTHIGAFAIPVAKKVKAVTTIEANPTTYELLRLNIAINEANNITPIRIAANDKKGELDFIALNLNSGGSKRLPILNIKQNMREVKAPIKVKADRLDDILPTDFDLIVMDIEGSEYFALKGMPQILTNAKNLVVEFIPEHIAEVANVSIEEFIKQLDPYFSKMYLLSQNKRVNREQFVSVLQTMANNGQHEPALTFSK